jgi:hypothetical protein
MYPARTNHPLGKTESAQHVTPTTLSGQGSSQLPSKIWKLPSPSTTTSSALFFGLAFATRPTATFSDFQI